jgi:multiple sugar transport system permease protein/putative aldouronate transport system permease protein
MILLPAAYIFIFKYVPMYGAQIAFRNYSPIFGFSASEWVGLANFRRFVSSPMFGTLLSNTLLLSLYNMAANIPFPILLAIGLNYVRGRHIKKTIQTVTYIPYFISIVVMVGILIQVLNPRYGVVNNAIRAFGGSPIDFFANPAYFRSLYVWSGVWQTAGWGSVIYIAALAGIDPQLHEAAIMDGADIWKRIAHVDFPGILPTVVIMLILSMGSVLSTGFEKALLMQNTLNTGVSEVIDTYVYKVGLASASANFSYSSAIGLFQSLIGFVLTIAVNWFSRRVSETSLW